MSTNKRHSRGGMKPLRQRGQARNRQRLAENIAALASYKAPAEEPAAWHGPRSGMTTTAAADVLRGHIASIDAQREHEAVRRERPLVRRFNPLALALCVALIGGDE